MIFIYISDIRNILSRINSDKSVKAEHLCQISVPKNGKLPIQ